MFDRETDFLIALIFRGTAVFIAFFLLPESLAPENREEFSWSVFNSIKQLSILGRSSIFMRLVGFFPLFLRFSRGKCRNCPLVRTFEQEMKGKPVRRRSSSSVPCWVVCLSRCTYSEQYDAYLAAVFWGGCS
jgi:hypothetical protein